MTQPADLAESAAPLATHPRDWLLLAGIVLVGAVLRFWNLHWDGGAYTFHPDEWALNETVRRLGPDGNPHFFFYGTLPIYLFRVTAEVLHGLTGLDWLAPERLPLIGRTYSALASTALLPLVFVVGRRLWGTSAGLIAAACTAGTALLIQAAHFGTVDTAIALAGMLLLWMALHIQAGGGARWYAGTGLVLGLAMATKLTAASFVLLPLLGHLLRSRAGLLPPWRGWLRSPLLLMAGIAVIAVLVASPYYVLAWDEFWNAIQVQSSELGGTIFSYTWQFIGATPYVFELRNLVLWSLGLPLGLAALAGWAWAMADCGLRIADWVRCKQTARQTPPDSPTSYLLPPTSYLTPLLLGLWPTLYLLYIGTWEARFVRHTLPLLPFCALFAAGGLMTLVRWLGRWVAWGRLLGYVISSGVVAGALGWGLAFLAIYAAPDTRLAATAWVQTNVPPGTRLVVEDKNDLVPVPDAAHPVGTYQYHPLAVTDPDSPAKMSAFATALATGEVLVVPNRRWAAVMPRLPAFPLTGHYYQLLFAGQLGYTSASTFASPPRLGPWTWPDDSAEETFQVFDHPTVRLFRNTGHLSEATLRGLLGAGP